MLDATHAMVAELEAVGATLMLTGSTAEALAEGLLALEKRGILREGPNGMQAADGKAGLLAFYAAPVLQRLAHG